MDIGGRECVVSLYQFSLVDVGIFKQWLTSNNKVLVELTEIYFETAE